jgi:hypothetical protein
MLAVGAITPVTQIESGLGLGLSFTELQVTMPVLDGSLPAVRAGLDGIRAYGYISLVIAVLISCFGVQRIDSSARGWRNLGFRLLMIPGLTLLWPWLIKRVWLGAPPAVERNAHRLAARP